MVCIANQKILNNLLQIKPGRRLYPIEFFINIWISGQDILKYILIGMSSFSLLTEIISVIWKCPKDPIADFLDAPINVQRGQGQVTVEETQHVFGLKQLMQSTEVCLTSLSCCSMNSSL